MKSRRGWREGGVREKAKSQVETASDQTGNTLWKHTTMTNVTKRLTSTTKIIDVDEPNDVLS